MNKILEIKSLAEYIDVTDIPNDWITYYDVAFNSFNEDWLNIDLEDLYSFYNFKEDLKDRITKEFTSLKKDINLNFLVYLWYFIMFKTSNSYKIVRWKNDMNYFTHHGSFMMPVIAFLMFYKEHDAIMKQLKFDDKQIQEHKKEIMLTCNRDKSRIGIDGVRFSQMIWASRFMKCHIISVGVLQYELKTGFLNGEDVIFIHIPKDTSLKPKDVAKSLAEAPSLVKKYLQVENIKYVTESWLLSPDINDILSENSNIKQFQKNFKILKEEDNIKDFLNFVFNVPLFKGEYSELESKTKLQKGLKEKLLNGKKLRIGLGILK